MKVQIRDREALSSLTTSNLRAYLRSREWADAGQWGERATVHSKEHSGRDWEILVPLRDTVADYAEVMAEAIATLAEAEKRSQLDVFNDLSNASCHVMRFGSPQGGMKDQLSIQQTADLLENVTGLMRSLVLAAETPKAVFVSEAGPDVAEYMDRTKLLPDYRGGYALTLHLPTRHTVETSQDHSPNGALYPLMDRIPRRFSEALGAVERMLSEGGQTAKPEMFFRLYPLGVSANLCEALTRLIQNGCGIDISLNWAATTTMVQPSFEQFQFTDKSVQILEEAARLLRDPRPL